MSIGVGVNTFLQIIMTKSKLFCCDDNLQTSRTEFTVADVAFSTTNILSLALLLNIGSLLGELIFDAVLVAVDVVVAFPSAVVALPRNSSSITIPLNTNNCSSNMTLT